MPKSPAIWSLFNSLYILAVFSPFRAWKMMLNGEAHTEVNLHLNNDVNLRLCTFPECVDVEVVVLNELCDEGKSLRNRLI